MLTVLHRGCNLYIYTVVYPVQATGPALPTLAPAAGGAGEQVRGRGAARHWLPRARQGMG